jgi:putative hemolysin
VKNNLQVSKSKTDIGVMDYVKDYPLLSFVRPGQPWYKRYTLEAAERFFGRLKIESLYLKVKERPFTIEGFIEEAFKIAQIDHLYDRQKLANLPTRGPIVFVANHPFGVIDGLALCDLAVRLRGNFRILINSIMCQDKDLAEYFLPVDFNENRDAVKNNIRSKQIAQQALRDEIPLIVFPSGHVSTATHWGFGQIAESPWTTFAAKMIRDAEATVVPVYFKGQNSRIFHITSHWSAALRSAALMNEVTKRFGKPIYSEIGKPLDWKLLKTLGNRQTLTLFLYNEVQNLASRHSK